MIKNIYQTWKKYSALGLNKAKYIVPLIISAILRDTFVMTFPIFASLIVDSATKGLYYLSFGYLVGLAIVYLLNVISHHWNFAAYTTNANYVYNKIQRKIVNKVATYDENFTKSIKKSNVINTTSNDIFKFRTFVDVAFDMATTIISLVISVLILFFANFYIGIIALIFTLLYFDLFNRCRKKRIYHLFGQRKQQDNIIDLYGQVIDGHKEIQVFKLEDKINNYLEIHKRNWSKSYFLKRKYQDAMGGILPAILSLGKYVTYIILIIEIAKGKMTIAELVLVIGYFEAIENQNDKFFRLYDQYSLMEVRIDRVTNLLNYSNNNIIEFGKNSKDNIRGIIDFEKVTFEYEKQMILKDFSLHIPNRSLTAIVGKSGSGKSTIFRLLLRLYNLNKGAIFIDGVDIYDYSKEVYSSNVSIATQKPFIFNMSIRDNLSLVDSNQKNQIKACKRVGIHNFIMGLPKGYNTLLKEDATDISGGQKQLISLARTLLAKSEILLFDEITSALDPNTSKQISNVLKDLKKDHTVIIITHSPTLMRIADNIVVINKGKIVGEGTHRQLLNNEYYVKLQK